MYPSPFKCCITMLCLLITMSACQPIQPLPTPLPTPEALSFETIAAGQAYTADNVLLWPDREPGLFVIAGAADVDGVRPYLRPEIADTLAQLDFTDHFALLAFDGWKGALYQDFQIQTVSRQDAEVLIVAQPNHKPGEAGSEVVTSLYQLIKVSKNSTWNQTIRFKLYFDPSQAAVVTIETYVP